MSSERINQVEINLSSETLGSISVNLITSRFLFETNIINIFKDEYNLNLNLIYNSKNVFNSNMNPSLGNYFKLSVSEYIEKNSSNIIYFDYFDRKQEGIIYYENGSIIHEYFEDANDYYAIILNDNTIQLKYTNGNII